jgi:hypothetical protein
VYIHAYVLVRVLPLKVEKLSHYEVGYLVVDGNTKKDDSLFKQQGINIESALTARTGFNYHWYYIFWSDTHFATSVKI